MSRNFPHIKDTDFPDVGGVDVYQYQNEFDYKRYDYSQMDIIVCSVPWDMGEAHVGNRTISGIGNVVYFADKDERREWFDDIPDSQCFRWSTKMRELHRTNTIDIPLPFDIAAKYNYLVVRYRLFANDDSPVEYESDEGLREWFWFIREVEFLAPNTTRLHLLNDAWQTFIYDLDISGMILERGHAPAWQVKAADYLANPIGNCSNLLADDVTADNAYYNARKNAALIFNDADTMAVIVTTANPQGSWGSKANENWHTPSTVHWTMQGTPAYFAFAVQPANLQTLLNECDDSIPQFLQTIKCIFFVSKTLTAYDSTNKFTFAGVTCYILGAAYKKHNVITLSKNDFAFPTKFANLAKLYTYPYSYIQLTDENGSGNIVRIEQTNGKIDVNVCVNMIYPFLSISAHPLTVGSASESTLTFYNMNVRSMKIGGNWLDYLMKWDIPVFGITQDASINNDYATYFDRKQAAIAYNNAYSNVVEMADCTVDNAALQVACNNAVNAANNTCISSQTSEQVSYNNNTTVKGGNFTSACANNSIQAQDQQAAIAAAAAGASAGVSAVSSLATLDIGGAIGAAVQGGISAGAITAQNQVAVNLESAQAAASNFYSIGMASDANSLVNGNSTAQITANNATTAAHNSLTSGTAANSAAAQIANGGRDKDTAQNSVTNRVAQTALNSPLEYGTFSNGDTCTTRPMGIFANVVTLDDNAIARVGSEFLRYGYYLNRQWDFDGNWNVCDRFTYWKLSDFWVKGLNIPDMYVDKIRFFLFGGVTVWRKPEYIGNTAIDQNGF